MKSLSKYMLENYTQAIINNPLYESVRNNDIDKALKLMGTFLKKRGVYTLPTIEVAKVEGVNVFMVCAFNQDNIGCAFTWHQTDTTSLHSVMFTKDFDTCFASIQAGIGANWDTYVMMKGASLVRVLQLVADVMNGRIGMDKGSLNVAVRDAQVWESEENNGEILTEANEDKIIDDLKRKRNNLYQKIRNWNRKGLDVTDLQTEYDRLTGELNDARVSVKSNVTVTAQHDPAVQKMEERFEEEERALPEERFADMESYITNVILGLDTCALICGAPGVGKTYRIMQAIKKEGKVRGMDYEVIKGKATPLSLYTLLHDYQEQGQILVIDDADSIIKDDVMINLIKAATDSSDERIVAYASSNAPLAPEEKLGLYSDFEQDAHGNWRYPKNFVYEGSIIIITNQRAGSIDTAIRSRALMCDLDFTTDEVLDLVEGLAPHIMPGILTPEAKERALGYLRKLADIGSPMEISIRSFTACAKMYMSNAPEKAIERRIREQMKLKFERTKSNAKY